MYLYLAEPPSSGLSGPCWSWMHRGGFCGSYGETRISGMDWRCTSIRRISAGRVDDRISRHRVRADSPRALFWWLPGWGVAWECGHPQHENRFHQPYTGWWWGFRRVPDTNSCPGPPVDRLRDRCDIIRAWENFLTLRSIIIKKFGATIFWLSFLLIWENLLG